MKRLATAALGSICLLCLFSSAASAAGSWELGIAHKNLYGIGALTSLYDGSGETFARESGANAYSIQVTNKSLAVGEALSCDTGTWSGSPTFTYKWLRNGTPIVAATASTYTTVAADAGKALQCQVTATNAGAAVTRYTKPRQLGSPPAAVGLPRAAEPLIVATNAGNAKSTLTCKPEFGWRWPASFAYQWLKNGAPIAGATNPTYTVKLSDPPATIQCVAIATNAAGSVAAASKALETTPAPSPAAPSSSAAVGPTIEGGDSEDVLGGAAVGLTLSCAGGPASATISYRWLRNAVPIPSATASTYATVAADAGEQIQCEVTASSAEGNGLATSAPQLISPPPAPPLPPVPGPAKIEGSSTVGATLTCETSGWTGTPSFAYIWLRNGTPIVGATASTYTTVAADAGAALQCQVTGTNAGGATVTYSTGFPIQPPLPSLKSPTSVDRPAITGTPAVGEVLSCASGNWLNSPTFTYKWLRNGTPIPAATASTYTTVAADAGKALQCQVVATNAATQIQETSSSVVVAPVGAVPPKPENSIFYQGKNGTEGNKVGEVLRCFARVNVWENAQSFTLRWLRDGVAIPGAELTILAGEGEGISDYTLAAADVHKTVQCEVTATNAAGSYIADEAFITHEGNAGPHYVVEAPPAATAALSASDSVTVAVALPPGLALSSDEKRPAFIDSSDDSGGFRGGEKKEELTQMIVASGWKCSVQTVTCTRGNALAPGESYPPIVLHLRAEADAPDMVAPVVTVSGGGASPPQATASDPTQVAPAAPFGISHFTANVEDEAQTPYTQAGGHPFSAATEIHLNVTPSAAGVLVNAGGDPREIQVELPPGFGANPQNFPKCLPRELPSEAGGCDPDTAVGYVNASIGGPNPCGTVANGNVCYREDLANITSLLYNLKPPFGLPAELGFNAVGFPYFLEAKLRSDGDYGVTAGTAATPAQLTLDAARVRLCSNGVVISPSKVPSCAPAPPGSAPFINNPSKCAGEAPVTTLRANSYQHPDEYVENSAYAGALSGPFSSPGHPSKATPVEGSFLKGCQALTEQFKPQFTFQPQSSQAETLTGAEAILHIPQTNRADTLMAPALKKALVTLPEGTSLNPSAANGLDACTIQQIGLIGTGFPPPNPIHFDKSPIECPNASKVGTLVAETPLLEEPLHGAVYLAAQDDNPFHSTFAIYLGIDDAKTGLVIKLAGLVEIDPQTGRITTTFDNNPQQPLETFHLHFFDGPQASLVTPATCGEKTTTTQISPWSAADPDNPTPAEISTPSDSFTIDAGSGGGPCAKTAAEQPFNLGMQSGSQNPVAGTRSPFSFRLTRPDGAQQLDSLNLSSPPGFTAYLKGVPYCPEAAIAAAAGKSGRAEQASPSCPAASQIGTLQAGVGPGPNPYYASGKLYLSGPYKGAPLSVVAIAPAVAGPFDLGDVVTRAAVYVNPTSARITTKTDPLPRLLKGVPLDLRDVRVNLDRPNWALNPTNCNPLSVDASAFGTAGATTNLSNHFQVGGCASLGFSPKLAGKLKGATKRGAHPALTATLTYPAGAYANIASAAVTLPHSEFLDQAHIRTVCTRVQFATEQCPAGSIYGSAEAITPLLDSPLTGNVYLRSSSNPLPDLVIALKGPPSLPIEIDAVGRIDSVKGGIRTTFDALPDAPLTKFTLKMQGAKKGLLINSRDLCRAGGGKITARFGGQNGKRADQSPALQSRCGKKHKKRQGKGKEHGRGSASALGDWARRIF